LFLAIDRENKELVKFLLNEEIDLNATYHVNEIIYLLDVFIDALYEFTLSVKKLMAAD
jgi:hypothetical protein